MNIHDRDESVALVKAALAKDKGVAVFRKGDVEGHDFHGNQYTPGSAEYKASSRLASLRSMSKKEVFEIWTRTTLGRVHNASIAEQNKSWMVHDIIAAEHGKAVAAIVDK
jgi:hypothetical protein